MLSPKKNIRRKVSHRNQGRKWWDIPPLRKDSTAPSSLLVGALAGELWSSPWAGEDSFRSEEGKPAKTRPYPAPRAPREPGNHETVSVK